MGEWAKIAPEYEGVVEIIGPDAAHLLTKHLGGTRIYVPASITPSHEIAVVIGIAKAKKLADAYHGTTISIPKARLREARAKELLEDGGLIVRKIALETDYSERQIYRFQEDMKADRDQLDLDL